MNKSRSARPTTSNADEWQVWLFENAIIGDGSIENPAFLSVQIVEAIEEHQKALAREVYGLAEDTASRFSDLASEDSAQGHYYRGGIHEAKSIARAIGGIMPYSRDPAALAFGGRERLTTKDTVPGDEAPTPSVERVMNHDGAAIMLAALEKIAAMPPRLTIAQLVDQFVEVRLVAKSAIAEATTPLDCPGVKGMPFTHLFIGDPAHCARCGLAESEYLGQRIK